MRTSQSDHVVLKLAVVALVAAVLGLPINNLHVFGLLALSVLVVFTGSIRLGVGRWLAAAALIAVLAGAQLLLPVPRIEEGHNVFLIDGPGNALERGLPPAAYRALAERFDAEYPADRRCASGTDYCWRPKAIPTQAFAFAADGFFDGHTWSRRTTGIDFSEAIWLRLGALNSTSLDILDNNSDVHRLSRDRRSLAIFGRWRTKLPYFVMYQFPAAHQDSNLCWRGEVLWERDSERFERIEHKDWSCRPLQSADIGRRIFGVAIGEKAELAMRLESNVRVTAHKWGDALARTIGVLGVLLLLVRWQPRRARYPLMLAAATMLLVVVTDVTMIGGYRPYEGGDDGLIFSGFAREMLQHLAGGDLVGALLGHERVFYFNPGMRYFRAIEFLFFGDTFLLYLLLLLAMPLIVHAAVARFAGGAWAFVFTLGFVMVPVGAVFGTTYVSYVSWGARGYSDTLGVMAFLAGLVLIAGPPGMRFDTHVARAFWGACLMAIAVIFRPNLAPAVAVMLGGVGLAAAYLRQPGRLAALCLGFSVILLCGWHNWHFGGVIVPLSANAAAPNVLRMTPSDYLTAVGELMRFQFQGEKLSGAIAQVIALLSGPANLWPAIPLHIAAYAILLRVVMSSRFEPMLRLCALASIALIPVALIYLVTVRYNLLMWLLMAMVVAVWLKVEGMELIDRRWPNLRPWFARSTHVMRIGRGIDRLRIFAGVEA
jgi:hypothetical protein